MRLLLRPGGVLGIVGLASDRAPRDLAASVVAVPVNRVFRWRRGWYEPGFPIRPPTMTYGQVRRAADRLLPGATFRRLLLFRYALIWRKPA
jgi:hypothetical protein